MNKNIKSQDNEIKEMLRRLFGNETIELIPVDRGNVKNVSFFTHKNTEYVLSLSESNKANFHNKYLSELLMKNNINIKKLISSGYYNEFYYEIHTKIVGETLRDISGERFYKLLPKIALNLKKINCIDISNCEGFGWFDENGQGAYASLQDFLQGFFHEKQSGYWKNWYELFEGDILDRDIFQNLYDTMLAMSKYCEGRRYLVHGDFHLGNIIMDDDKITGIIDWDNAMYGDFIYDIATLQGTLPQYNIAEMFKEYYEANNTRIPYFDERFKCMSLCKGLDSLRFFAKHGWKESYNSVLQYLKEL